MCGIAGIIEKESKKRDKTLTAMVDAISHRGPDDDGFYTDKFVGLGMRRLSIIDLALGKQPISSADGKFLIFFNGEIYNYKELRAELEAEGGEFKTESDTEVVLRLYELEGAKCLLRLRGMFAIAIYNTEAQELFLARDFFGIKPLYYLAEGSKFLAFSSEIKSFQSIGGFEPEVNDEAFYNYLSYQYNPLEESFIKGVYKLPPGHFMQVDTATGKFEIEKYFQFSFDQDGPKSNKLETKERILDTMRDSVTHHMIADVPVGSFLSGGIDSSIIATLVQEERKRAGEGDPVKTFTVTFGSATSEGKEAKVTAEPLGTEHREIEIGRKEYFEALPKVAWHFDEPVADPSAVGLYFLAQEASKHVKVVLSGEGADELFGGYNIYLTPLAKAKLVLIPKFVLKIFTKLPFEYFGKNYLRRVCMKLEDWYFGQKYFNESIFQRDEISNIWKGESLEFVSISNLYKESKALSESTQMQYIDINTWLVGDILAKADKMTMAHSLELRVPFLDKKVARLAATLPDKFKWRGGVTKYLLREAFKGVLPEETRKRRKLGFPVPVRDWFRTESKAVFTPIFKNPYLKNNLDLKAVERLLNEHRRGERDHSRKLYLLLIFAIWYDQFIKVDS